MLGLKVLAYLPGSVSVMRLKAEQTELLFFDQVHKGPFLNEMSYSHSSHKQEALENPFSQPSPLAGLLQMSTSQ